MSLRDEFIVKANKRFNNKYDYSEVVYKNNRTKVKIICPIHGSFEQKPYKHILSKTPCPRCRNICYNLDDFIRMSNHKHNNKYDYSLTVYEKSNKKVKIICPIHGAFLQTPNCHLSGNGCFKCAHMKQGFELRSSKDDFIIKSREMHGNVYNYEKVEYLTAIKKVRIICKIHGEFLQTPNVHLSGGGCPYCANCVKWTKGKFISESKKIHGNKYDYSKVIYKSKHAKVDIICPIHGLFSQTPASHLSTRGCSKCTIKVSKPEKEISNFIKSLGINIKENIRGVLENKRLELDIWIPSHNIAIEFNGIVWHSCRYNTRYNILRKSKHAWDKNIDLIHIRSDLWDCKKDICKSIIKNRLGLNDNKVWARKCKVLEIDTNTYRTFCNNNHLQGFRGASIKRGLYYKDELVAAVGVSSKTGELIRYVVKMNWSVGAALSKLIKNIDVKYSFCDLSVFNGKGYITAGFIKDYITKPNYRYVKSNTTISRESRQRHKLNKLFNINFNKSLTEEEICAIMGEWRIYDCGNIKFVRM